MAYTATDVERRTKRDARKEIEKENAGLKTVMIKFNEIHLHVPLQLTMAWEQCKEWTCCSAVAFSCTCVHDIVFSPCTRKSLLSLPFTDREPMISSAESRCKLLARMFMTCTPKNGKIALNERPYCSAGWTRLRPCRSSTEVRLKNLKPPLAHQPEAFLDTKKGPLFKAGPPPLILSFWSFLTFLHYGIEKVETHRSVKTFHKKIRRKSWSNVPPKLLACIGFLYKVVHKIGRLRKFNGAREI